MPRRFDAARGLVVVGHRLQPSRPPHRFAMKAQHRVLTQGERPLRRDHRIPATTGVVPRRLGCLNTDSCDSHVSREVYAAGLASDTLLRAVASGVAKPAAPSDQAFHPHPGFPSECGWSLLFARRDLSPPWMSGLGEDANLVSRPIVGIELGGAARQRAPWMNEKAT